MKRRRRIPLPFRTKAGRYGTMYRYRIDCHLAGEGPLEQDRMFVWAYDSEHAEMLFFDSPDAHAWVLDGVSPRLRERSD